MIGNPNTGTLQHGSIRASVTTGFKLSTADGRPARLAIIDADGNVVEAGTAVEQEAWNVCLQVQRNFWQGQGHLVVHSGPPASSALAGKEVRHAS